MKTAGRNRKHGSSTVLRKEMLFEWVQKNTLHKNSVIQIFIIMVILWFLFFISETKKNCLQIFVPFPRASSFVQQLWSVDNSLSSTRSPNSPSNQKKPTFHTLASQFLCMDTWGEVGTLLDEFGPHVHRFCSTSHHTPGLHWPALHPVCRPRLHFVLLMKNAITGIL